ncbi:MAG: DUF447 domain-containing protein [Pseudohongiellaceae bacterium]
MMIYETIVTSRNEDTTVQIAPMGVRRVDGLYLIAPFKPSRTLENLQRTGQAVINLTDDVRIFAGCLTGRYDWSVTETVSFPGWRLQQCCTHLEIVVEKVVGNELRPEFYCRLLHEQIHKAFHGFNRAQAAVLEAAILASRLDRLPVDKIRQEIDYLRIAIDKTAGVRELEAWNWLCERIDTHLQQVAPETMP